MSDDARGTILMGPHGPLRDMGVYDAGSTGSAATGEAADGGAHVPWADARAQSPVSGGPAGRAAGQWSVPAADGPDDVAGVLSPVWRTGTAVGLLGLVVGMLMILGTSGLAAVVLWPLGALSLISGASVLWATHQARRAARRMSVQVTRVRVVRSWP